MSRDIDAFIDDPQYLSVLSPDVTDVWRCDSWDRAAHYLKLRYPEGEIDFIVSGSISSLPTFPHEIDIHGTPAGMTVDVPVEPPTEIALKKIYYRASMLKPRDIFDIAVVDKLDHDRLIAHLGAIAHRKNDLLRRLDAIRPDFLREEVAELDIQPGWDHETTNCLSIVRSIAGFIPDVAKRPGV